MSHIVTQRSAGIIHFDQAQTIELLDFHTLIDEISNAAAEYEQGLILSPKRTVLPLGQGGVLTSMPATAPDLGIHKLVGVQPANVARGIPTIHGLVTVCEAATGRPLFTMDGVEVTGRRTAALSMLGIRALADARQHDILLFGTGAQARFHVQAIHAIHPDARIRVRGIDRVSEQTFCDSLAATHAHIAPAPDEIPESVDIVITVTTSNDPIYDAPARKGCLVIGVGAYKPEMAEIGKTTIDGSDVFVDDPTGTRQEAGDLLRAGVDWSRVRSLGSLIGQGKRSEGPFVFKTVGTGAWDLAAARAAAKAARIL